MKSKLKSAIIASGLGLAFMLPLTACSDSGDDGPHVFGGSEVPPEVLSEPRVVKSPTNSVDPSYPRLGDVPAMPTNFSSRPAIQQAIQNMEEDRAEGERTKQQYEHPSALAPPAVQP